MLKRQCKIEKRIERIKQMEINFNTVKERLANDADSFEKDEKILHMLKELINYYDNGLWLEDYISDEKGELPSDLNRGVLSEDGIYNLLSELKDIFS